MGLQAILLSFLSLLVIDLPHSPLLNELSPKLTLKQIAETESRVGYTATLLTQRASSPSQIGLSVPAIARQVTARILTDSGMGSGAIIQHQGQTYTVVTCEHVVAESQDNHYTILTADGRTHASQLLRSVQFPNTDLALMQFTSNQAYRVVTIANSKTLAIGSPVYASGFPNWYLINSNTIESTRNWGNRAFRLTSGKVAMLPQKSLQEGYQLGYTNEIEQGMSGGPVLDEYGRLVGINGRLKYPPQGIISFIFADGTVPSEKVFQQMETLSWAIPTAKFRQTLK